MVAKLKRKQKLTLMTPVWGLCQLAQIWLMTLPLEQKGSYMSGGLSILVHDVISLPDAAKYDKHKQTNTQKTLKLKSGTSQSQF